MTERQKNTSLKAQNILNPLKKKGFADFAIESMVESVEESVEESEEHSTADRLLRYHLLPHNYMEFQVTH